MRSVLVLTRSELRLFLREWPAVIFAVLFPALLMTILAGVFGDQASPEYGGVTPAAYYVADYLAVPLATLALLALPVTLATYHERGILRRLRAAGVPLGHVLTAQGLVIVTMYAAGLAVLLATAALTYGIPPIHDPALVAAGLVLGIPTLIAFGVAIGLGAGSTRSAHALGLLTFLPLWLLGAGGPPRAVMPEPMSSISDILPLGRLSGVIRPAWLGTARPDADLPLLAAWLLLALVTAAWVVRRQGRDARST